MSSREVTLPAGHVLKISTLRPQAVVWRPETPADHMTATPGQPVELGPWDNDTVYSVLGRASIDIVSRDGKSNPIPPVDLSGDVDEVRAATAEALAVIAEQKKQMSVMAAEIAELRDRKPPPAPVNSEDLAQLHDQINDLKADQAMKNEEIASLSTELQALKNRPEPAPQIHHLTREFIVENTDAETDDEIKAEYDVMLQRHNELQGLLMNNVNTKEQADEHTRLAGVLFPYAGRK